MLNNQQSCVINAGFATQHLTLKMGAVKVEQKLTKSTDLYNHSFPFTAYADDSTFFLKDISWLKMLVKTLKEFSCFSGLKPNITKCKIVGLGPLKEVSEAVNGLKTIIS